MSPLTIPSFAKINWILKVVGRRPDGFHEVVTILQTIDLHDLLHIERQEAQEIGLSISGLNLPGAEGNLVWKAAEIFLQNAGIRAGVRIRLEKRVPIGAGLGGGSSNAATTLLALNTLFDSALPLHRLCGLAELLGSDVPFFLFGGTACARGRGEVLECLPDPPKERILLLYPDQEISTARAYELGGWPELETVSKLTRNQANTKILRFRGRVPTGGSVADLLENDFEGPILRNFPRLAEAAGVMREAGCRAVTLCGSGSTLLGWADPSHLEEVAGRVRAEGLGQLFLCETVSRLRYRDFLEDSGVPTLTVGTQGQ